MNRLLIIALSFFITVGLKAQQLTNSWINYDQDYHYFQVIEEGVYRLDYDFLIDNNIDAASISTEQWQIWGRGQQSAIFTETGGNQFIDQPGEYLEFYAKPNDGYFDTDLFEDTLDQINPYYSMFNDTAVYYLSWSTSGANKRVSTYTENDFASYPAQNFVWHQSLIYYYNKYSAGQRNDIDEEYPTYTRGSGWVGPFHSLQATDQVVNLELETPNKFDSPTDSVIFKTIVTGQWNHPNFLDDYSVWWNVNGVSITDTAVFNGFDFVRYNQKIPSNIITGGTTMLNYNYAARLGADFYQSWTALPFISLDYPHSLDFEGKTTFDFYLKNPTSDKWHVKFVNMDDQGSALYCWDHKNALKVPIENNAGWNEFLVPANQDSSDYTIYSDAATLAPDGLKAINGNGRFNNWSETNASYLLITSERFKSASQEYLNYRNTQGANGHLFLIEELYHQFGHGIAKHPRSIREFTKYAIEQWSSPPEFMFLIGKSIRAGFWHPDWPGEFHRKNESYTKTSRRHVENYEKSQMPTWGVPGSDNLITAGLTGSQKYDPAIATGRLSVTQPFQILDYLNKVKAHESAIAAPWMKEILHLGGGAGIGESTQFANYLRTYEEIAEDTLTGIRTTTVLKTNTKPLETVSSEEVRQRINEGVSLMTFFGHAYGSNFDQSIDHPSSYENTGRHPLIIANSCLIGDLHTIDTISGSEKFVLVPEKGAIAYIASVGLGVPFFLHKYTRAFYNNFTHKNYGATFGQLIQHTIRDIQHDSELMLDISSLMTLHGDPAVGFRQFDQPDYNLFTSQGGIKAFTVPTDVTSDVDSFEVHVIANNLGMAILDSIDVTFERKFANGDSTSLFTVRIGGILNRDTISVKIPTRALDAAGLNSIDISLDAGNVVSEFNELNNSGAFDVIVKSGELLPVYPYNLSIVKDSVPTLIAASPSVDMELHTAIFEIDTSAAFDPPLLATRISQQGNIIKWSPESDPQLKSMFESQGDSTTYFWRISRDTTNQSPVWITRSFTTIQGQTGWSQSHIDQISVNDRSFLNFDEDSKTYSYRSGAKELHCYNTMHTSGDGAVFNVRYTVNNTIEGAGAYSNMHAVILAVIDPITHQPWFTTEHNIGQHNNITNDPHTYQENTYDQTFFFNASDGNSLNALADFITDSVPENFHVLLYSFRDPQYNRWPTKLNEFLINHGSDTLGLKYIGDAPFIFYAQKGSGKSQLELHTDSEDEQIELIAPMYYFGSSGSITSPRIGPSSNWENLYWNADPAQNSDTILLDIVGINQEGKEIVLLDSIDYTQKVIDLSGLVDPDTFSYIRLVAHITDSINYSPELFDYWNITYQDIPEFTFNAWQMSGLNYDSLQQGETFQFISALENLSDIAGDSMSLTYWLVDKDLNVSQKITKLTPPITPLGFIRDTIEINSLTIKEDQQLWLEINARNVDRAPQPEKYHYNNLTSHSFFVDYDRLNPLLDVTFDNQHLIDGTLIPSNSVIKVLLKDENQYLALDDTSQVDVFIKGPLDLAPVKINFAMDGKYSLSPVFTPGDLSNNQCSFEFTGQFPDNGRYELMVNARDKSDNKVSSGAYDYSISFEVIRESTITNVVNYPNPFSTFTQFVFTLTGDVLPDDLMITIMTVSGKVVRQITLDELGPLQIGNNITEFRWDGTDEFGDLLANGVYLYKVTAAINGEAIELRETEADQFFHQGWGKMYLMR